MLNTKMRWRIESSPSKTFLRLLRRNQRLLSRRQNRPLRMPPTFTKLNRLRKMATRLRRSQIRKLRKLRKQ